MHTITMTRNISWAWDRLDDPAYIYDPAGNLTASPSGTFTYDPFNMVITATGTAKNEHYLYTAEDERIAQLDLQTQPPSLEWTLRGLDQKVLRTYASDLPTGQQRATWTWEEDYIYRGSSLLATTKSTAPNQPEHFHLDHLGTPRLRTSSTGTLLSHHKYLPYGEELTDPSLNPETMRFTGHERDVDPSGWENDLDYMHARYYSPRMGRFFSLDPMGGSDIRPQSWNRYAYVLGNPVNLFDPLGLRANCVNQGRTDDDGNPILDCNESDVVESKARDPRRDESFRKGIARVLAEEGPGPCDASCQVMAEVATILQGTQMLETGAVVLAGAGMGTMILAEAGVFLGVANETDELIMVSRWGRSGLRPGDWIMKGPATRWNYIRSFKWDFLSPSNQFARFTAGEEFLVLRSSTRWPSGFGVDGVWKGLFGQRIFIP